MATRNIMRIDLTGPARQKFDALSDRFGMTQLTINSRLVEWLARQSPETLKAIMLEKPGDKRAALMALRQMAGE